MGDKARLLGPSHILLGAEAAEGDAEQPVLLPEARHQLVASSVFDKEQPQRSRSLVSRGGGTGRGGDRLPAAGLTRQLHRESREVPRTSTLGAEGAAMEIDDCAGDGEAKAETRAMIGSGLVNGLEQARGVLGAEANAIVSHGDADAGASPLSCDSTRYLAAAGCEFHGVALDYTKVFEHFCREALVMPQDEGGHPHG